MSFQFSLIRFVPDPARGEFVNIGAVAGSDEAGEWGLRLVSDLRRAQALDERGVLSDAVAYATDLAGAEPISSAVLQRRSVEMQNVVQLSAPAPVAGCSVEAVLNLVFDQLVAPQPTTEAES